MSSSSTFERKIVVYMVECGEEWKGMVDRGECYGAGVYTHSGVDGL